MGLLGCRNGTVATVQYVQCVMDYNIEYFLQNKM